MQSQPKQRLGDILVMAGLLTEQQLGWALGEQQKSYRRLGEILLDAGLVTDDDLADAQALQMDLPHIHLKMSPISRDMARTIPESIARTYNLVPVSISSD